MDQEYDDATDTESESPAKGLRAQLEKSLEDKRVLEKELSDLRAKVRKSEVSTILAAKGANPRIAQFIPSDVEGEEGVAKWLEENADVFGGLQQSPGEAPVSDEPAVPQEVRDSAQRMQNLSSNAQSPSKIADIEARMKSAQTADELQELWAEAQRFVL